MTEQSINNLVHLYFDNLNNKLNANTKKLEQQPGGFYHVPTIVSLGNFQRIDVTEGAFNLIPPEAGMIRDLLKQDSDKTPIVIRRILGYSALSRIESNPDNMNYILDLFTTEMILTLQYAIGFKHTVPNAGVCYGSFARTGVNADYFRDMDNYAGMELRLYSDTWPCVTMPYLVNM